MPRALCLAELAEAADGSVCIDHKFRKKTLSNFHYWNSAVHYFRTANVRGVVAV